MEEEKYGELFRELNKYEKKGVHLEIEGFSASPTQIVQAHMVKEGPQYMRDYVLNEKGDIKELYFHKITK